MVAEIRGPHDSVKAQSERLSHGSSRTDPAKVAGEAVPHASLTAADEAKLRELLTQHPPRTDLFTAVRLIERLMRDRPRLGDDGPFDDEGVFFRHDPSFAFRPAELSAIHHAEHERPPEQRLRGKHSRFELTTCVLGLSGADSPMPLYHAADLIHDTESAEAMRLFLDLFHNRMTALMYRARNKYDWPQEFLQGAKDVMSSRVLAFAGVDAEAERTDALDRTDLLRLSSLLAFGGGTARSFENALTEMLADTLDGAPLSLEQFTGGWVTFEPSQRISLGRANSTIGDSFVLGTRALHPAHRAKVVIGPISPALAKEFSPGGAQFARVRQLAERLSGEPIGFELELLVSEDAYPPFVIGTVGRGRIGDGVMLTARKGSGRVARRKFDLERATAGA